MLRHSVAFVTVLLICAMAVSVSSQTLDESKTLVVVIGNDAISLDPIYAGLTGMALLEQAAQPLMLVDPATGKLMPNLATSWQASDDGKTWTFHLREGVKFHDGTAFDAEAVKRNFDRFKEPGNIPAYSYLADPIVAVNVVDDLTVNVVTEMPFAPLLRTLATSSFSIVSPTAIEQAGLQPNERFDTPIGTGPFTFVEWVRGEKITMARNPEYWGDGPYVGEIEFRIVPEDQTRVMMVEAGQADVAMYIPAHDAKRLEGNSELQILRLTSTRPMAVTINTRLEPMNDVRVRQAINYAIDKEALVNYVLGGAGSISQCVNLTPSVFGYWPVGSYEYDLEKARDLMAEAGYANGFETSLYYSPGRYASDAVVCEALQMMLQNIGITVTLMPMEWAELQSILRLPLDEASVPLLLAAWMNTLYDAFDSLDPLYHSSQQPPRGSNRSFLDNPAIDALLEAARYETDEERRLELYKTIDQLLWQEVPNIMLYDDVVFDAVRANVSGLVVSPTGQVWTWGAWVEE